MRQVPETANRADWPRLVSQAIRELQRVFATPEYVREMLMDLDTDGNPVPTYKAHIYTYDGSGNLQTDTITDGTNTWVRTYDTSPTGPISDSGWVKQ